MSRFPRRARRFRQPPPPLLSSCSCARSLDTGANWDADELRSYILALDRSYDELHSGVLKAQQPLETDSRRWSYYHWWLNLYGQWKQWFSDTNGDWFLTFNDNAKARDFGASLDDARQKFRAVYGTKPPGDSPRQPAQTPTTDDPIASVVSVLKWGALAYLIIQGAQLIRSK